jgi:hypothetical protein
VEKMKSLNYFQLCQIIQDWSPELVGAQVQHVFTFEQGFVLSLYRGQEFYLIVDLRSQNPCVVCTSQYPNFLKKVQKPLGLFINSHVKNIRIQNLEVVEKYGRFIHVNFFTGCDDVIGMDIILIPGHANASVAAHGKKIFWAKPEPLMEVSNPADLSKEIDSQVFEKEWFESWRQTGLKTQVIKKAEDPLRAIKKALEKKEKAIGELEHFLSEDKESKYQAFGEFLKSQFQYNSQQAERDGFVGLYNDQFKVSDNMRLMFEKSKELKSKKKGAEARLEILKSEVSELKNKIQQALEIINDPTKKKDLQDSNQILPSVFQPKSSIKFKGDVQARKLELSEGLIAYIGKSAKDNLKILRQAQSWDYWIHLKDYPSAHAIIRRRKGQIVPVSVLQNVGRWLIKESIRKKNMQGERFDCLFVECRFVRPIKGDKVGRVTYQNEQAFVVEVLE